MQKSQKATFRWNFMRNYKKLTKQILDLTIMFCQYNFKNCHSLLSLFNFENSQSLSEHPVICQFTLRFVDISHSFITGILVGWLNINVALELHYIGDPGIL